MRGLSWMDFSPARGGETERARRYGSRHNAPSCERNWHGGQRGPDLRLMLADRLGQLFARLAGRQESHQGGEECPRLSWLEGLCPRGQGSHATMQGPSKPASAKCPPSERPTPAPPVAGPAERPPVTPPAERPTPAPPVAGPAERPPVTPPAERPTPAPPVAGPAEPGPIVPDSTPASLDQQYRANVVRAAEEAGDGWAFESSPTPRLLGPSDSWQMGTRELDGQQHSVLELKPGADPTRAVQDLFVNRQNYAFDCATAVRAVGLKAELDTVGADTFSQSHSDLFLFGHYDSVDGNQDSGAWRISAGPSVDYGAGPELGAFDPTSDRLQPGELRYFENPGDTTSENQGWNVIYLGQDAWGQDRFWRTGGEFTGGIEGQYLSDLRGTPDLDQLSAA